MANRLFCSKSLPSGAPVGDRPRPRRENPVARAVALAAPRGMLLALALLAAAPAVAAPSEPSAAKLYFPPLDGGEWETLAPEEAGFDAAALEAAVAYAGAERSSGFVVLHRGRIVAERHWKLEADPDDPQDRVSRMTTARTAEGHAIEDTASVQKSVLSFLAGVARGKGLLDLDAPVSRYLGEGWSKAGAEREPAITVRHLMAMATGLEVDGSWEAPPGEIWMYNTPVYSRLVQILEHASGLSVDDYTRRWLTARIGMRDSRWTPRTWAGESGAGEGNTIGFSSSARDLARFGLLVLAGGKWENEDVLGDPTYLAEAVAPSQSHNPSYGLLWWLNGRDATVARGKRIDGPLIPTAPADLFAAQGALGRKVYVVPSLGLVVTRLGDEPARDFNVELWRRLMAAVRQQRARRLVAAAAVAFPLHCSTHANVLASVRQGVSCLRSALAP